jgi:hypothetical protein
VHRGFFLIVASVLLILVSSNVYSRDCVSHFEEDLIEGEDITITLEECNTLEFTYYNKNYSIAVWNVYSNSVIVRIEKTARPIAMGETWESSIDDDANYDFYVTLLSVEGDEATFEFELNEKPEMDDDDDEENQTNTTSSTTSTNSATNSSTNTLLQRYTNRTRTITRTSTSSTSSSSSSSTGSNKDSTNNENKDSVSGASTINVTINIKLTPKSAGLLLITSIVLGGLFVFNKIIEMEDKKKNKINRAVRRFKRTLKLRLKIIFKKLRLKLGELIAGKEFKNKEK